MKFNRRVGWHHSPIFCKQPKLCLPNWSDEAGMWHVWTLDYHTDCIPPMFPIIHMIIHDLVVLYSNILINEQTRIRLEQGGKWRKKSTQACSCIRVSIVAITFECIVYPFTEQCGSAIFVYVIAWHHDPWLLQNWQNRIKKIFLFKNFAKTNLRGFVK